MFSWVVFPIKNFIFYLKWKKYKLWNKRNLVKDRKWICSLSVCLPLDVWIRRWTDFVSEFSSLQHLGYALNAKSKQINVESCWNIWPVIFVCPSVCDHVISLYMTYVKNLALNGLFWIRLYLIWGLISYSWWPNQRATGYRT